MTVLDTKLSRDLRQSKGMLAAIISIIAAGICCFVGLQGTSRNLSAERDSYYATCRMADFWIDLKKMPVTDLQRLSGMAGIAELRSRISHPVVVVQRA